MFLYQRVGIGIASHIIDMGAKKGLGVQPYAVSALTHERDPVHI